MCSGLRSCHLLRWLRGRTVSEKRCGSNICQPTALRELRGHMLVPIYVQRYTNCVSMPIPIICVRLLCSAACMPLKWPELKAFYQPGTSSSAKFICSVITRSCHKRPRSELTKMKKKRKLTPLRLPTNTPCGT